MEKAEMAEERGTNLEELEELEENLPQEAQQARLDLRGEVCPFTFIRTKLRLDKMQGGEVLEVILDDGEPIRSVPRSVKEEGHQIFRVEVLAEDSAYRLLIRKG